MTINRRSTSFRRGIVTVVDKISIRLIKDTVCSKMDSKLIEISLIIIVFKILKIIIIM